MSAKRLEKIHAKFNNGIDVEIPIKLKKKWDRHNFEKGKFKHELNKIKDEIHNNFHNIIE